MSKNIFIAIEGIDGSGKSTQLRLLAEKIIELGSPVYATHEPTAGIIGQLIRDILQGNITFDHLTIASLFVADRLDHILNTNDGMLSKIQSGNVVITDRYYFSSYAYHGVHVDLDWIIAANSMSAQLMKPDLHIFIDVPAEESMNRIHKNRKETEFFESLSNLKKVREKYFEVFDKLSNSEQILIIDGTSSIDKIHEMIWGRVRNLLNNSL
ncbi:MAG: dTMP kinase [Bacteroidota bacterium]|nr:dTMP kinase [Bacteroidota bacterium]